MTIVNISVGISWAQTDMFKTVLESQTLGEIVALLRENARHFQNAQAQKAPCVHVDSRVTLTRMHWGEKAPQITVMARELSGFGMGFLCGIEFMRGEEVVLILPRARKANAPVRARVKSTVELSTGVFWTAVEFMELLKESTGAAENKPEYQKEGSMPRE